MLHTVNIPENISAKNLKVAIVSARFNEELTQNLVNGASQFFLQTGGNQADLTTIRVPGAYEVPFAAALALESNKYDAIVALGVIIEGATPHFDKLCTDVTEKISLLSIQHKVPIGFGVVMARNLDQAVERASPDSSNKGREAMAAAIEMAQLKKSLI